MNNADKSETRPGLGVSHRSWTQARDALRTHFASFIPVQVVTLTPQMCVRAREDEEFRRIIENARIVIADGISVVWGENRLTGNKPDRIPGTDLATWALAEVDRIAGKLYLLGAKPDVVEKAAREISLDYPRLTLSGFHHGYFTPEEEKNIVTEIAKTGPHLLLVGMGSPRQECFIREHLDDLGCAVAMGVGGSFDIWSGTVRRAPEFFRKTGMEWLYRTVSQPGDRLKRIPTLLRFVRMVLNDGAAPATDEQRSP
jgi:N-acetylglucosaminyldiphosphoundecaprenol N-acetyl-beta-D-mannosaminyltransferase